MENKNTDVEKIINADYRIKENRIMVQNYLKKFKAFKKYEEKIPLEAIEKQLRLICNKYYIMPQWLSISYTEETNAIYSLGMKTSDTHKWINTVYGITLYEVFAKALILAFFEVKKGNVKPKEESNEHC